ncbi:MAG: ROK family protein, partial [Eubacteriales bacterium]|nr:ROK family protein [Eubacteriales bacterium]
PGLVDAVDSRIIMAPNLGWQDVDFKSIIAGAGKKYKDKPLPVYLENESMATAIFENWSGTCRKIDNFICVNIKSGIGAGIFINGKPYRGADGTAGEIGHMSVGNSDREGGIRCGCGNIGCLETMAAAGYLERKASRIHSPGSLDHIGSIAIEEIAKAAREGDSALLDLLKESGRYLGIALADIINILNPRKIVIGKEFVKYADIVMDTVRETIAAKALKKPAAGVETEVSATGGKASVTGAALMPVKTIFGR